jgi:hypothetical protein
MHNISSRGWFWIRIASGVILVLGIIFFVVLACNSRQADVVDPTPVGTATFSPAPTFTPTPTVTPTPEPLVFDGDLAYQRVLEQCGYGARPTGSVNNELLGDYLISSLEELGWAVKEQAFVFQDVPGRNIVATKGEGPLIILGAHYDTRPYADHDPPETQDQYILGANDGGSGVAVLLELARVLDMDQVPNEVRLVFFDAEDRGRLDGWPFSVGAEEYAKALEEDPQSVIIVDMVGDQEQTLYWDGNSDPELNAEIWDLAAELGYDQFYLPEVRWTITDDHVPFARRGWPAIDIIDFDYPYWHTTQDTADKVSAESLDRVGKVIEAYLEGAGE